jgi:uncharacterized SAM-binding protein YcdF (DUF218 family)
VNELLGLLGIQTWKPVISALLLPPVPFLLLALVGARMMFWRRGVAWLVLLLSCAGIWLSCSMAVGHWLQLHLLQPPVALSQDQVNELRKSVTAGRKAAIVVLGGGREALAPEYGVTNLLPSSLARLHYAHWLARQTNAPLLYSGGVAWGEPVGVAEAEAAARISERDYGRPLKWQEGDSRDTRENAARSVALLKPAGVTEIVLVTHGWHMKRALRAFDAEIQRAEGGMHVTPAPMGLGNAERGVRAWLPSAGGYRQVNQVLHEAFGVLLGA